MPVTSVNGAITFRKQQK